MEQKMINGSILETVSAQLFTSARTHNGWLEKPVPNLLLEQAIEMAKWGPTSANSSPLRILFIKSPDAKARLKPALAPANLQKTLAAPVTAILAYDLDFFEHLPRLYPATDARSWFLGNESLIFETAFRNGTLQAAYFLIALRALGLDVGPMSGFDKEKVDAEFFVGTKIKSNFLMNIGYGDQSQLYPRGPRFDFHEIAEII
jgi:3-hydroxypropanoate dehydrogenase